MVALSSFVFFFNLLVTRLWELQPLEWVLPFAPLSPVGSRGEQGGWRSMSLSIGVHGDRATGVCGGGFLDCGEPAPERVAGSWGLVMGDWGSVEGEGV